MDKQTGIFSIHSRLSQPQRTKSGDAFRAAPSAVLFTTDVSARGVDYPDVTLVIQVCHCVPVYLVFCPAPVL